MNKRTYECYSLPLMKYLHENNQFPIRISVHRNTKKTMWIYNLTDDLNATLQQWSKNKK